MDRKFPHRPWPDTLKERVGIQLTKLVLFKDVPVKGMGAWKLEVRTCMEPTINSIS